MPPLPPPYQPQPADAQDEPSADTCDSHGDRENADLGRIGTQPEPPADTAPAPRPTVTVFYDGQPHVVDLSPSETLRTLVIRLRVLYGRQHDRRPYGLWLMNWSPFLPLEDLGRRVGETAILPGHTLLLGPLPPHRLDSSDTPLC